MVLKEIDDQDDFDKALKEAKDKKFVLIDFHATWCGPCKLISPYVKELSEVYTNWLFLKVDVDEVEDAAETYGVTAMPTFVVLDKSGEKIGEMVGAAKDKLKSLIDEYNK